VEDHVCLTGGEDGNVRLWDLRRVDDDDWGEGEIVSLSDVAEEDEGRTEGEVVERMNGIRSSVHTGASDRDACARLLEGHTKAVTALYFEDDCLVGPPTCTFSQPIHSL
jgi:division protein 1